MAQFFLPVPQKKILLVANTAWNLWNYRLSFISALQAAGKSVSAVAPGDAFAQRLREQPGLRFRSWPELQRRGFSLWSNSRAFLALLHHFREEKPDLVILYTIKPNILGNFAARLLDIPVISVVEGLGHSAGSSFRWRRLAVPLFRTALRKTRAVVFLNDDDCREFLNSRLITPAQAKVVPGPGVDTRHFAPQARPNSPVPVFLFCGRLLVEKGIREFVSAARELKQAGLAAEFRVLGAPDPGNPGTLEPDEVETWEQEGAVKWLGATDDVRPHLAASDVLVLPSRYREGVPRSVLEAMAMGKVIITTDTPGCRDTVDQGRNGLLVPPGDQQALTNAMKRLAQMRPDEREKMALYGLNLLRSRFSDNIVLPMLVALTEGCANSASG